MKNYAKNKYVMKLKNLLLVIHVGTRVYVAYRGGNVITSGYPIHLFEELPDEILDLQVINVIAEDPNKMDVILVRGKQ